MNPKLNSKKALPGFIPAGLFSLIYSLSKIPEIT
jgi:hypothetical protein